MMLINVPRAKGLAERRLDGHPIAVMEQVAVCELAVAAANATEQVEKIKAILKRQESEGGYDEMDALDDIGRLVYE
jgi:hypothetical protein